MTIYNTPNLEDLWASEGGMKEVDSNKYKEGWKLHEFPPSEVVNFLQNKIEEAVAWIIQNGFPEWLPKMEYKVGSYAAEGGLIWKSTKANNIGNKPEAASTYWKIAFDNFGDAAAVKVIVDQIVDKEGYLKLYVSKARPVMDSMAFAPAFQALAGLTSGFNFKEYPKTSVVCVGGDLVLNAEGVANGRIKKAKPTLEMNDNTLVTTELLNKVVADIVKKTQIPVGYTLITNNKKPPSDKDQLGYGSWELDLQGRVPVGVSTAATESVPDWAKDVDSKEGEYARKLTAKNLPPFRARLMLNKWVGSDDASEAGAILTANRNVRSDTQYPWESFADFQGENLPFDVVQPSQTKYFWTRIA